MMELIILLSIIVAYILVDLNYFVRMFFTCVIGKFLRPKLGPLDTNVAYGIALFSDVDTNLDHINNARFLREFDFGRVEFGVRTGLAGKVMSAGGSFPINYNYIRYRLAVKPFTLYKTESKILYWDDKYFYMEQKLVTLRDGIVRCVAYPKVACYNSNAKEMIESFLPGAKSPPLNTAFCKMNEIGELISDKYKRKQDKKDDSSDFKDFSNNLPQEKESKVKSIQ